MERQHVVVYHIFVICIDFFRKDAKPMANSVLFGRGDLGWDTGEQNIYFCFVFFFTF